jgi:hypothetical protein
VAGLAAPAWVFLVSLAVGPQLKSAASARWAGARDVLSLDLSSFSAPPCAIIFQ